MIWMILVVTVIFGGQPGAKNAKGNELYQQKKYDEALMAYQEAQADEPDNPSLHYNIGNTLYQREKYPEAIQAYKKALNSEKPLNNQAYYNLGNSLYRLGQLKESIEAYKRGLRIQSDDTDMKYNLEFVQRQLQD
ncbi:MAG TPA: hypothetical protein DIT99_00165, partial [Candidatus Latescibacteria bacterium]|nr:hypothetical protein [Candidatus Latescibacterota bacterium]